MIVLYGIFLVLLACMDLYLIGNYQREKRREEAAVLDSYVELVEKDLEEINTMLYDIYANNSYFQALEGSLTELEEYDQVYELDNGIRNRMTLERRPHGYIVYYHANECVRYFIQNPITDGDDIRRIKEAGKSQIEAGAGNWQWSFLDVNGTCYGILICMRERTALCMAYSFKQAESSLHARQEGEVFFTDGGSVFGAVPEGFSQEALKGELEPSGSRFQRYSHGRYIYGRRVKDTGLWICMAVPATLWSYLNLPQLFLLLLTLSSLVGAYLLYRYMYKALILPLREMIGVMERIQEGEWDAKLDRGIRFEELKRVNVALSVMVSEIKKQKLLSYEQTIEKQRAQMQYLQLQLKPHFYLNGLKTLNALAMQGENGKLQDLIIQISKHLRYLFQSEKELVPLQAEIDYVNNYASLQSSMTGRLLSLEWEIQEGLRDWRVPNLCIQTFVENSFKYAKVGSPEKELVIRIQIHELETEDGSFLDICIQDNGTGYPDHILEEINDDPARGRVSVGINNLKRRCRLLYGELAQYGFYNEEGAVSNLVLPWQGEEGADENTDRG